MTTRTLNKTVPKPTGLHNFPCARCRKSWHAIVGCRYCGEIIRREVHEWYCIITVAPSWSPAEKGLADSSVYNIG
jgi:hypothetical protein